MPLELSSPTCSSHKPVTRLTPSSGFLQDALELSDAQEKMLLQAHVRLRQQFAIAAGEKRRVVAALEQHDGQALLDANASIDRFEGDVRDAEKRDGVLASRHAGAKVSLLQASAAKSQSPAQSFPACKCSQPYTLMSRRVAVSRQPRLEAGFGLCRRRSMGM